MPYQATLLSLLDPAYVRRFILRALGAGLDNAYEINYMSGKGEGRRYAFNDMSIFSLAQTYLRVSGDASLLLEVTEGAAPTSVLCALLGLATGAPAKGPLLYGLADFGSNQNLLECVPQYAHGVPALNAASGWMRLELATLLEALSATDPAASAPYLAALGACSEKVGVLALAAALRSDAALILAAVQKTYVGPNGGNGGHGGHGGNAGSDGNDGNGDTGGSDSDGNRGGDRGGGGGGYWRSVQPDGTATEVRTVIDLHTIGSLVGAERATPSAPGGGQLRPEQRSAMAAFAKRELITRDWMRALSLEDTHANVSSFRPDHGTIGSYDAWPAQTIDALVTLGLPADALALLRSIAQGSAMREGVLGQARILVVDNDRLEPRVCNTSEVAAAGCTSRKAAIWMQQAYNAAGAAFANTILRTIFGFQPPLPFGAGANASGAALFEPRVARGFNGSIRHLQWRGAAWTLTSDATGLRIEVEQSGEV